MTSKCMLPVGTYLVVRAICKHGHVLYEQHYVRNEDEDSENIENLVIEIRKQNSNVVRIIFDIALPIRH